MLIKFFLILFIYRVTPKRKKGSANIATNRTTRVFSNHSTSYELDDNDLNIEIEKITQKYLAIMVTSFAICLSPLMILK